MADQKKLDRWADKLLDTGKRNNLINFRDSKASSAEVVFPDCEHVFSKCAVGRVFEIFDPKIPDELFEGLIEEPTENEKNLSKSEYREMYSSRAKGDKYLLIYAQTPNPITAVKNIAKKAKSMQDETGINVAYLAFGFIRWNEKEGSDIFFRAPLLLVHVNIETGTVLDPIKIEISDDDVVVNPTFDYLLQAEYGLSLPPFEDGDSLSSYYQKVTRLVQRMGWKVLDECKLGIFSFLKINMYEDLKKNADLILENNNVQALMGKPQSQTYSFAAGEPVVGNPLIDLHTVVDADSSQIEAVEMAKSGKSFVLQGPPGTGKSQTITNIIAECLYDGKKVLFVSEKQAALNVVYDKLKKAGLADFCLELHSHKANKKAVIEELNRTLEMPKSLVRSSAQEEIRQKAEAQKKLDNYANELHKKRSPIDMSLYQLFEAYSAERNKPSLKFDILSIRTKGQDYLLQAVKLLEQYVDYIPSIGYNYKTYEWYGFTNSQIGFEERNQLFDDMEIVLRGYQDLKDTTVLIKAKYDMPKLSFQQTLKWQSLLSFASESDVLTPALLSRQSLECAAPVFADMMELSQSIVPLRDKLLSDCKPEAIDELDGASLHKTLVEQYSSFLTRLFNEEYKKLIETIQPYLLDSGKLKYPQAVALTDQLMKLQELLVPYKEKEAAVSGCLGPCYAGPDTDWEHVITSLETLRSHFDQETESYGSLTEYDAATFQENRDVFRTESDELTEKIQFVADAKARLQKSFSPKVLDFEKHDYDYCLSKLRGCLSEGNRLGNWIGFINLLSQLHAAELLPYIDIVIQDRVNANDIVGAYRKAFYRRWIEYVLFTAPDLSSFSRILHDQTVKSFVEKDRLQYEISKIQIKSKISQQRPNLDLVAGGSSVAILRREGQKKRKQLPIRKLLAETGDLVQIIKPCFLMSPLSVSTFLDPAKISFDTIVFDEASQIFPQDAVGAIYRGKQLIVVGDSKQMPPSNFFSSSADIDDEDDEIGDITDFESILDICSSVFSTERLAWHYRSHYEQLIAFSNANFYNNKLITFPSASTDHKGIGVDFYHVDGTFDRKSKTNKAEAQFIVDLIYKNIEEHPNRSLGVVAFSVAQQNLIDNLLSKKREGDPSREWFFNADHAEPFFVKNLETVQGDERDTIIFSIAYARDSQGRFLHNFGPLNREGGERRLNVAVTRAKDNIQLVSSIYYTDINLNNTGSEGVRLLRAYLDYAQNGEDALERMIVSSGEDEFDSEFELEVCEYLRDQGFTVDTQVGCSGYRIDLALRKPNSSHYLLAIECDGATYHNSKNARDRDSLRQRVLENMGWQFYRIWSTDWYQNKSVEKERLLQAAKAAVEKGNNPQPSAPEQIRKMPDETAQTAEAKYEAEVHPATYDFPQYKQVDALRTIYRHSSQSFDVAIREILETEAPLSEEYLLKRIVSLFDREKVTKPVIDAYNYKMRNCARLGIIRRNGFLYLKGNTNFTLRVPGEKRDVKYISKEELADGFYTLIKQNVSVNKESLYKTMTNVLGFSRTGEAIVTRYESAIKMLESSGLIKYKDGQFSIVKKN